MPKSNLFVVPVAKYLLKEKRFLLTAVRVFAVLILFTAPLFSIIRCTGEFTRLVKGDNSYYLMQQAAAQEENISTSSSTPLPQQQDQEAVSEEGQQLTIPTNQTISNATNGPPSQSVGEVVEQPTPTNQTGIEEAPSETTKDGYYQNETWSLLN